LQPSIEASFEVTTFGEEPSLIPLLQGPVAVLSHEPADAVLVISDSRLCLSTRGAGNHQVKLQLLVAQTPLDLSLPPCPSTMIRSLRDGSTTTSMLSIANAAEKPLSNTPIPLPSTGASLRLRWPDPQESAKLLKPSSKPVQGPVAAVEEAIIRQANWSLRVEPDGAMLAQGVLEVDHTSPLGVVIDAPAGMKWLSCQVAGKSTPPIDLGNGRFHLDLPAVKSGPSRISLSLTSTSAALDPVEGTLAVALPKTPLFVQSLSWEIQLPVGYQAETHGNLTRLNTPAARPDTISLIKNLLRDERPETRIFYQRTNLTR
jgi:hypothetical protein